MTRADGRCRDAGWTGMRRARPLLGTIVTLQLDARQEAMDGVPWQAPFQAAADAAFGAIAHIERVMSAHRPDSDLGRLARAAPGSTLGIDPHTANVLRHAQQWWRLSRGAFDPALAARRLGRCGLRPAFDALEPANADLSVLTLVADDAVHVARPLQLDLGGIAKGYAVDLAVATLQRHGVRSALVNAGGDLRAFGPRRWPVELRSRSGGALPQHGRVGGHAPRSPCNDHHPHNHEDAQPASARAPRTLCGAALASSERLLRTGEFVYTVRGPAAHAWQRCTVRATDCVTADALTKWGLQAPPISPRLRRELRAHGAALWRN